MTTRLVFIVVHTLVTTAKYYKCMQLGLFQVISSNIKNKGCLQRGINYLKSGHKKSSLAELILLFSWWSWWESNPRPKADPAEGTTCVVTLEQVTAVSGLSTTRNPVVFFKRFSRQLLY